MGMERGSCWAGLTTFSSDPTKLASQPGPSAQCLELAICGDHSSSAVKAREQRMIGSESSASHSVVAVKAPLSQQRSSSCQSQVQAEELGFCSSDFHLMHAHHLRSMGLQTKSQFRPSHCNLCSSKRIPLVFSRGN